MFKKIPRKVKLLISVLLSAVILFFIYRNIDIPAMTKVIGNAQRSWFLIFLALFIPQLLTASFRWNTMTLMIGKVKIPFLTSWHHVVGSYSANLIIPGKMGEVVRIPWMRKNNLECPILVLVFMEKMLDIFSIVLIMMSSLVFLSIGSGLNDSSHRAGVIIGLSIIVAFVLVFAFRKSAFRLFEYLFPGWVSRQKPESIYHRTKQSLEYLKDKLPLFLLMSIALWLIQIFEFYVIFRMFGVDPGFFEVGFGCSLALLAGAIPVSIAGIGPRDAVIISYFSSFATVETLAAIGIITILRIVIPALTGLPSFFLQSKK